MKINTEISDRLRRIDYIDTSKLKIVYITTDHNNVGNPLTGHTISGIVPIFWAMYEDKLLYCICDYLFGLFEGYDDWSTSDHKYFNTVNPGEIELKRLLQYKVDYFIVKYDIFLDDNIRDEVCQIEMDIISKWNRDKKITSILNDKRQ